MKWLKRGVPIMAFPEGRRSKDGRLMEFKGGIFSMAVKTRVPIVPITISHAHAVMPSNSLLPVQSGAGKLHVHVHEPISTTGRSEADLSDMVRQAFLSSLPLEQHPLAVQEEEKPAIVPKPIVIAQEPRHDHHHHRAPKLEVHHALDTHSSAYADHAQNVKIHVVPGHHPSENLFFAEVRETDEAEIFEKVE